jgi:hypothetical protein
MMRVGEFSDDVCDRLKLKVSMKVTITIFGGNYESLLVMHCLRSRDNSSSLGSKNWNNYIYIKSKVVPVLN